MKENEDEIWNSMNPSLATKPLSVQQQANLPQLFRMPEPTAKIAPSVLACDFGILAAECTRMIKDGADWLHMGEVWAMTTSATNSRTDSVLQT